MASEKLTDYERRRLENIRRNGEMMASLLLPQKAASILHLRPSSSSPTPNPKKPKLFSSSPSPSPPVTIRRSLRTQGLPPSSLPSDPSQSPLPSDPSQSLASSPNSSQTLLSTPPRKQSLLRISDAISGDPPPSDRSLMEAIRAGLVGSELASGDFDPRVEMVLRGEHAVRVCPDRILSVRFLPFRDRVVLGVGDKVGNLGFWDVDAGKGEEGVGGLYVYGVHSGPVSGITVHPSAARKIFTSSYDGFIRLMDIDKETFNVIYASDFQLFSVSQMPNDHNSIYFGEGAGHLKAWDERMGKVSGSWLLHEDRINTVDFNPETPNLVATSSSDGTACLWDLRSMHKDKPKSLNKVQHCRAVHSAFFSPGGSRLATTSIDNTVGLLSGANFEDLSMILHKNQTGRWLSSFRAIWGWDESWLYIGNMSRLVDVISVADKGTTCLASEYMTSVPCRFAAHPYIRGSLACTTAGGKVYLWTKNI